MNNIFDSHAHYDSEAFNDDRKELLNALQGQGVCGVIDCGCDKASSLEAIKLSEKFGFVYAAIGVHPHEAAEAKESDLEELKALYSKEKVVAVGEIGLDYHYDFSPRSIQLEFFEKQLLLANELSLPVIVHDREAHEDTLNLLKKYKPKGVVHCFSGSAEMAKEVLKLGMYIGLGGAVTFKNARKPLEVAAVVPEDRLLLET
ncbi:MAG: TatD family hydrolase, partial [Clostridia bacterium]|nr:TatD family hydrolase [Clostridia bacterium]